MNIGGITFVGLSWGVIVFLTAFCFYKVLSKKKV